MFGEIFSVETGQNCNAKDFQLRALRTASGCLERFAIDTMNSQEISAAARRVGCRLLHRRIDIEEFNIQKHVAALIFERFNERHATLHDKLKPDFVECHAVAETLNEVCRFIERRQIECDNQSISRSKRTIRSARSCRITRSSDGKLVARGQVRFHVLDELPSERSERRAGEKGEKV